MPEPQEKYTLDSEPETEEASPEAITKHVRRKTKTFQRTTYNVHSNTWITQAEVNDLVLNFELPTTKAQLLGSRFQQWEVLEKDVKVSFYRKSLSNIAKYFSINGDMLYCKDVCGLMEELQLQHVPELWGVLHRFI